MDDGGLEATMLTVSFYQPISLFVASSFINPCLEKVNFGGTTIAETFLVSGIVRLIQLLLSFPIELVSDGESFLESACP